MLLRSLVLTGLLTTVSVASAQKNGNNGIGGQAEGGMKVCLAENVVKDGIISQLQKQAEIQQVTIFKLTSEISEAKNEIQELITQRQKRDAYIKQLVEINSSLTEHRDKLVEINSDLSETIAGLSKKLASSNERLARANEMLASTQEEMKNLVDRYEQLVAKNDQVEANFAEVVQFNDKLASTVDQQTQTIKSMDKKLYLANQAFEVVKAEVATRDATTPYVRIDVASIK